MNAETRVGVWPTSSLHRRGRLLDALARAFDLEFVAAGEQGPPVAGVVVFSKEGQAVERLTRGLPSLEYLQPDQAVSPRPRVTTFGRDRELPPVLRGRTMAGTSDALSAVPATRPLATSEGVVWWGLAEGKAESYLAGAPPPELGPGETLRASFGPTRFTALLPLVHFLRALSSVRWRRPGLRAAVIVDDPNLHWPTYGYLAYSDLVAHARLHGYHVSFATIPLDAWYVHGRTASLLASARDQISLTVHGCDHSGPELSRVVGTADARRLLARANRRVAALERRSGLSVDRVMVPPHGACSNDVLRSLRDEGFAGIVADWPLWWAPSEVSEQALAAWEPADLSARGIPLLTRLFLPSMGDELVFAALLDQPLLAYAHHWDFEQGLSLLERLTEEVHRAGDVRWQSLGEILRSNYATSFADGQARVRLYSRDVVVSLPEAAESLVVSLAASHADPELERVSVRFGAGPEAIGAQVEEMVPIPSDSAAGRARISLDRSDASPSPSLRRHPPVVPFSRRVLTELRDRTLPLRRRRRIRSSDPQHTP